MNHPQYKIPNGVPKVVETASSYDGKNHKDLIILAIHKKGDFYPGHINANTKWEQVIPINGIYIYLYYLYII